MYDLSLLVFYHGLKLTDSVCNGCYDLTMLSLNISDIAIITVIWFMTLANLKEFFC